MPCAPAYEYFVHKLVYLLRWFSKRQDWKNSWKTVGKNHCFLGLLDTAGIRLFLKGSQVGPEVCFLLLQTKLAAYIMAVEHDGIVG